MKPTELDRATVAWCHAKSRLERITERQIDNRATVASPLLIAAQEEFDKACDRRAAARIDAKVGAGGRNRTGTGLLPSDFKSDVSTNFTTPA